MIDLINFIHDKKLRPEESLDRLKNTIDSFSNQSVLDDFYEHFDKNYGLDKKIVKYLVNFSKKRKKPLLVGCNGGPYTKKMIKLIEKNKIPVYEDFELLVQVASVLHY